MVSLAVKYRPKTFGETIGQDTTLQILTKQKELNKLEHCYLFCGGPGTGKTTTARNFANLINDGIGNPIEIDGAANNSVENIRAIIDDSYTRSISGKYKIYIIDECQMIGGGNKKGNAAWSAMLKLIEEPPEFTIFIFCTTDPQKIPDPIFSRVMRFNFNRLNPEQISSRLKYICESEHFTNYADSCEYISRLGNGSMRASIALLEKVSTYSTDITIDNTIKVLGNSDNMIMFNLVNAVVNKNDSEVIKIIEDIYMHGTDIKVFIDSFISFCMDIVKFIIFDSTSVTKLPDILKDNLKTITNFNNSKSYYLYLVNILVKCKNDIKYEAEPKLTFELVLLNLCRGN